MMLQNIFWICDDTKLISGLILLIASWWIYKFLTTPKNLPPGPWGVPILGYLPFLGKKSHIVIANLKHKYGDVIRINMGYRVFTYFTSFKAIKEALVKQADVFSIRPVGFLPPFADNAPGIAGSNGEIWADFRRFSLATLRDLGVGKSCLEQKIQDEILFFVKELKSFKGEPAQINKALRLSITNIICVVVTGHRFEYNDQTVNTILHSVEEYLTSFKLGLLTDFLPHKLQQPWFLNLFGISSPVQSAVKLHEIFKAMVDEHYNNHQPGIVDNFINAWFTESERHGAKSHNFTKTQLLGVVMDLFVAGTDTTTTVLLWGILFMIKYPEVQSKVQKEIDEIIGKERTPMMSDQKSMPYTEATLMEINRRASIAPLSLIHGTTKDTTVHGYLIPKGSYVMANLWSVHHDPEIFANPFEFNPDRFLTDNQQLKRMEELIPFSMGKRQCMGESLARMELFLYFTSMLQNFVFKAVDGVEVDLDYEFSIISPPKAQNICAVSR